MVRRADGRLIGFFNFVREGDEVRIGLGIRPDLTGQGLGSQFIDYVIALKQAEIDRYLAAVTDWEQREYFRLY